MVGTKAVGTGQGLLLRAARGGGLFERAATLMSERVDRSAAEELRRMAWLGDAMTGATPGDPRNTEMLLPGRWSRLV
jgi:hypothetical protein